MDRDALHPDFEPTVVVCGDYTELAQMITKWQEQYEEIMPQIEEFCNRSICHALMRRGSGMSSTLDQPRRE